MLLIYKVLLFDESFLRLFQSYLYLFYLREGLQWHPFLFFQKRYNGKPGSFIAFFNNTLKKAIK